MAGIKVEINGKQQEFDIDPNTPLLWVLREHAGLVGTKYGCGIAQCGSCTVHLNGTAVRSCAITLAAVEGKTVTTIEGLSEEGDHPVQKAWVEHDVAQCGYCQAGQIMSAAALLASNKNPSDEEIHKAMHGNLCRCGTYTRIRTAIKAAAKTL
jgi:isoquinoline 1-oxidoreductase alpha subunit